MTFMYRMFLGTASALAGASCAHAAVLQATPATLTAQAKAAQPGDVIQLATGAYGEWAAPLNLVHAAPGVRIQPAPGAKPVFTRVNFWGGAGGYTLQGIEIRLTPSTQYGVNIEGVSNITLQRLTIHQADNKTLAGDGVFIRSGNNIRILDNDLSWLSDGVDSIDSTALTIASNNFHDIEVNGTFHQGSPGA